MGGSERKTTREAEDRGGSQRLAGGENMPGNSRSRSRSTSDAVCVVDGRCGAPINLSKVRGEGIHSNGTTISPGLGIYAAKACAPAYERDPQAVERWLKKEYPDLVKRAKAEKASIFWGDEMGVRSDHQAGRFYSPKGKPPSVQGRETGFAPTCFRSSPIEGRWPLWSFLGN